MTGETDRTEVNLVDVWQQLWVCQRTKLTAASATRTILVQWD